jgi:hypothetical protein
MKLQEVLTEYQYNNVGQFRAIAESLGYKEAYNKGSLLFTRNDEVFRIDMDKIRSHTKREPDLSAEKASMDRVCQFFSGIADFIFMIDHSKTIFGIIF